MLFFHIQSFEGLGVLKLYRISHLDPSSAPECQPCRAKQLSVQLLQARLQLMEDPLLLRACILTAARAINEKLHIPMLWVYLSLFNCILILWWVKWNKSTPWKADKIIQNSWSFCMSSCILSSILKTHPKTPALLRILHRCRRAGPGQ